jgi:hypothetical protein
MPQNTWVTFGSRKTGSTGGRLEIPEELRLVKRTAVSANEQYARTNIWPLFKPRLNGSNFVQ